MTIGLLPDLFNFNFARKRDGYSVFLCDGWIGARIFSYTGGFFECKFGLSRIAALFRFCGPTAIARSVSDIVINALQRESDRFFSHISEKILEAVQPSFANIYTAIAIKLRHRVMVFGASGFHVYPGYISRSACLSVGPMGTFFFDAPAGFRVSGSDFVFGGDPIRTTVAFKQPSLGGNGGNGDQPSVAMPCNIERCGHE